MSVEAAKFIGAGLALIGLAGVGVGIGNVFSAFITSVARNPSAEDNIKTMTWVGFALVEAVALYALLISLFILV